MLLLAWPFTKACSPSNYNSPSPLSSLQYSRPVSVYRIVDGTSSIALMTDQDRRISEVVAQQRSRLRNFIRRRVANEADVEDVLQDVFYELVEANRLLMPIEYVTGWLFQVARNRITDLFRKKKPESISDAVVANEADEALYLEDLLPSPDAGPDAVFARNVLLDALEAALEELPEEQRDVFVAH